MTLPLPSDAPEQLSIGVFCGAASGTDRIFEAQARAAVRQLVMSGYYIVYGGASVGLMRTVADEALANGGTVIGVIPEILIKKELLHSGLSEVHVVATMHERKKRMSDLSRAFLILPGGAGTFEEMFEQWTWTQLGFQSKLTVALNIDGYFDPLRQMIANMVRCGFMHERHTRSLIFVASPDEIVSRLVDFDPPAPKW